MFFYLPLVDFSHLFSEQTAQYAAMVSYKKNGGKVSEIIGKYNGEKKSEKPSESLFKRLKEKCLAP